MSQHAFNCIDIVTSLMASRIVTSLQKDKQYRYFEQGIQCLIKTDKTRQHRSLLIRRSVIWPTPSCRVSSRRWRS